MQVVTLRPVEHASDGNATLVQVVTLRPVEHASDGNATVVQVITLRPVKHASNRKRLGLELTITVKVSD